MSESDAYIEAVLARHLYQPGSLVPYAVDNVIGKLKQWAGTNLNRIVFTGSVPKLTAVSGTTDVDILRLRGRHRAKLLVCAVLRRLCGSLDETSVAAAHCPLS